MKSIRKFLPSKTAVLVFFIYIVPAFICLSAVLLYYLWLPFVLGAPAPGAEVVHALHDGDAETALKEALACKKKEERSGAEHDQRRSLELRENGANLLSLAYELNWDYENALAQLRSCVKRYDNRYRFAALEYRTGNFQEAFDDYIEIARETIVLARDRERRNEFGPPRPIERTYYAYASADPETRRAIRRGDWAYICAEKHSQARCEFEARTFPFEDVKSFCAFMEEMAAKADDPEQYAEELQFWLDLRDDFDRQDGESATSTGDAS